MIKEHRETRYQSALEESKSILGDKFDEETFRVAYESGFSKAIDAMPHIVRDITINVLNEALALDADAVSAMFASRVFCNRSLAEHPEIQVSQIKDFGGSHYLVGVIGLVNGILGRLADYSKVTKYSSLICSNTFTTDDDPKAGVTKINRFEDRKSVV